MNTKLSTNFAPLLKELVLDGGYISFFSKVSWIPELHAKRVVWRPLRESGTEKLKLAVVVPAARQLSSATQAFATLLTRLLNDAYEATVAMDDALPSDTSKRKTTSRKSAVALAPPAKHHRVKTAR
jgi:hypothetical protein